MLHEVHLLIECMSFARLRYRWLLNSSLYEVCTGSQITRQVLMRSMACWYDGITPQDL